MKKSRTKEKQHISKPDILLMAFFIAAAVLLEAWMLFGKHNGTMLQISYDGSELYTISLGRNTGGEDAEQERFYLITYPETTESGTGPVISSFSSMPECPAELSYNLVSIRDGKVTMEAADCRDQICVHHIPISGSNESIICLPHKLVVTVVGEQEGDSALDGVVK